METKELFKKNGTATKINTGITDKNRKEIAEGLKKLLADNYFLYLKTQNYHWNIKTENFIGLHLMLEEQYTTLSKTIDVIAERIRALGYPAPGSFREFKELSDMKEGDSNYTSNEMIEDLLKSHEMAASTMRSMIRITSDVYDEATIDLLTEGLKFHEKTAWILRSSKEN